MGIVVPHFQTDPTTYFELFVKSPLYPHCIIISFVKINDVAPTDPTHGYTETSVLVVNLIRQPRIPGVDNAPLASEKMWVRLQMGHIYI